MPWGVIESPGGCVILPVIPEGHRGALRCDCKIVSLSPLVIPEGHRGALGHHHEPMGLGLCPPYPVRLLYPGWNDWGGKGE